MAKHYLYSDFSLKVQFYQEKSVDDENTGTTNRVPVETFKVWAKPLKRTRFQNITAIGAKLQDTVDIVVNHDDRIAEQIYVSYNSKLFTIVSYVPDDSWGFGGYDTLTIKQIQKEA